MRHRVSCEGRVGAKRCGAHRDLTLSPVCFVCGSGRYASVPMNRADLEAAIATAQADLASYQRQLAALRPHLVDDLGETA